MRQPALISEGTIRPYASRIHLDRNDYVGRATVETGTLKRSVHGPIVVKNMVRQSVTLDDFRGNYVGAFHKVVIGCANLTLNGTVDVMGTVNVIQNGTAINILHISRKPTAVVRQPLDKLTCPVGQT